MRILRKENIVQKAFRLARTKPKDAFSLSIVIVLLIGFTATMVQIKKQQEIRQRAAGTDTLSIVDFGATPDDTTDDTAAINQAITAARSQGKIVFVPQGKFNHTSFYLNGAQMTGQGETSILYAPDPNSIQIILQGNNPSLTNMKIVAATTTRSSTNKYSVYMENATNYVVDRLTVDGANDAGILSYRSSYGQITNNHVQNTLADAIHITGGSHDIYIARNTVRNSGDDMIAVVSYNDGQCDNQSGYNMVFNVLIEDNDAAMQTGGRGISVVGGKDVTIRNNTVSQSNMAGLYLASESSYSTCSVNNIRIENNSFDSVSTGTGHPAILIYADATGQSIQNILFSNNTISNSPTKTGIEVRNVSTNVALISNIFSNTRDGIYKSSTGNVYCISNTFNGNVTPSTQCGGIYNFTVPGSTVVPVTNTPTPFLTPTPTVISSPTFTPTPSFDTTPPSVSITNPINGAKVTGNVRIQAASTDNIGTIKTEIYVDNVFKASSGGSSISTTWSVKGKSVTSGTHIITAKAYDAKGNVGVKSINVIK